MADFVDIGAHDLFGHAFVVRRAVGEAPATELGEPPLAVLRLRVVAVAVTEDHVVGVAELAAVAHVVFALEAGQDGFRRAVDIAGGADDLGLLGAVLHVVEPDAGLVEGLEHGLDGVRVLGGEGLGEGADFLRVVLPDRLGVDAGESDAVGDGLAVPRFADAEAVHLADLHVGDHLRRRDGDQGDIGTAARGVAGVDAAGGEPVAQPHGVGAGREGHRESHRIAGCFRGVDQRLEGLRVGRDFAFERIGEADRLAVAVEDPGDDHRDFRRAAEAHGRGDGHAEEHVSRLDVAVGERVADGGPARAFGDGRGDAVFFEEPFFVGDDDGRAVGQGDDAEVDVRGFRGVGRVGGSDPAGGQAAGEESEGGGLGGATEEVAA
jgi:hypothetical protein